MEDTRNPRVFATVQIPLYEQITTIADRDGWTSMSGFVAHLIRLGLNSYCDGENKIFINLNLGESIND